DIGPAIGTARQPQPLECDGRPARRASRNPPRRSLHFRHTTIGRRPRWAVAFTLHSKSATAEAPHRASGLKASNRPSGVRPVVVAGGDASRHGRQQPGVSCSSMDKDDHTKRVMHSDGVKLEPMKRISILSLFGALLAIGYVNASGDTAVSGQ